MIDEKFLFLNDFENRFVENLIENFKFLLNPKEKIKIMVGVSGGSDSICLLYLLNKINEKIFFERFKFSFDITVVHINHLLRGDDSINDEKFVENFCKDLKIKFIVKRIDFLKNFSFGLEEKARNERYKIFYNISKENNITYLFLAHNYDDDAETIFMKMLRGTGITGMLGMKKIRSYENENFLILRPLLIFKKSEIEKYLFLKNINFVLDKTNLKSDFFRNKIRNEVFPKLEKFGNLKKNLINLKKILEEENIFFNQYFSKNNEKIINIFGFDQDPIILDNEKFLEINKNFLSLALYNLLKNKVNFVHIEKIKKLFLKNKNFKFFIKENLIFIKKNNQTFLINKNNFDLKEKKDLELEKILFKLNKLFLEKKSKNSEDFSFFYEIIDIKNIDEFYQKNDIKDKFTGYFDYDLIKKYLKSENNLIFRKRLQGDFFIPFGRKNLKSLKDYLSKNSGNNKKIFLAEKGGNEIFWILGDRISDKLKITSFTKTVLKIKIDIKNNYN